MTGGDAAARLHARRGAATPAGLSARTLGSFVAVAAILAAFVVRERSAPAPLVRLGILRSGSLVRANLAAMSLFGGWVGFQFIVTLYLQQLRGWSALETGLAIFPGGLLVALVSPRIAPLIMRFGVTRLILAGMISIARRRTCSSCRSGSTRATLFGDAADVPARRPRLRARVRAAQRRRRRAASRPRSRASPAAC